MHAVMRAQDAGLVCSLVTGVDDRTLGATLDNSAMNSDVSPSLALLNLARIHPAVLGKSMLFRRSVFEALGGFESVASLLAEDYVIGRMFAEAGYRIAIAPERVRSPIVDSTVRSFVQRQLRWAAMRWKLAPSSSISEPMTRPLGALLLALAMGAPLALACLWAAVLMVLRDGYFHCASRGRRGLGRALVSAPLRELLSLWVALAAPFVRDVCWRNKRVRLSAGTRLYVRPPRPIRRRHPSPT
jgi:ceramide glucosyltransferase